MKDSWYNGIKYNESQKKYEFQKISFYDQAGNTKPNVNGFALPVINSSKANDQITLPKNEQGEYIIDYSGSGNPTLKKVSYISEVTPNTLFNSNPPEKDAFMVVNKTGFKAISLTDNAAYIPSFNGTNITMKRLFSPKFLRYSLEVARDCKLPASGTTLVQDIFQDLTGVNIESNSMIHLKIFFYLEDTAVQENNITPKVTSSYGSVQINNQSDYEITENMLIPDVEITNKKDILIYHTHTCESYTPSLRI